MREVLIFFAAAIAALLILRSAFRRSVSRWLQYALWSLAQSKHPRFLWYNWNS